MQQTPNLDDAIAFEGWTRYPLAATEQLVEPLLEQE
jgi:hypothetical protein